MNEDNRPGPVLLAHDVEKKILVITDAGDGDTFAELLMGVHAEASGGITAFVGAGDRKNARRYGR